jgi:aspartyl-tRNA(Asn)/glutamyl-tRNA(Gln) amidotransferase subunit B
MSKYEPVIGLEVHVQLNTKSKIFCTCSTNFGDAPNSNTCPVCLGLPGSLPVLNRDTLRLGVRAALALNCEIAERLKFDRKNYFYPDCPKAYQISQFDKPVSFDGKLTITLKDGTTKDIGITRAHLEEDAGKMIHDAVDDGSLVDYNRTGTPLLEIVSEPDIRTPEEAYAYLTKLKTILQYTAVSDCNMQEGSLRCDANISLRPKGQEKFGTKVEVKNLNSFRAVQKSLEYEIKRQDEVLSDGGTISQETRLWNDAKSKTLLMRSKEHAHDYRYFPEPDLVPFTIARSEVDELRSDLPELPDARLARFKADYDLSNYDASVLVAEQALANYFEKASVGVKDPKVVSNWIQSELVGILNERKETIESTSLKPEALREMIDLIDKGTINGKIAKEILPVMVETGKSAEVIVEEKGLVQISDTGELEGIVKDVITQNEKVVNDFKSGKKSAIGFLVGQVMQKTKGKANPGVVNQLLQKKLSE